MHKPSPAILLAASFAFIVVQLDVTIVNVALPQIGRELGAGVAALQWVVDAYTLGFAVFLLTAGVLGDRFGARRIFLAGLALFALASLACAVAPGALALNLARALQGVGAALMVPSSLAILNAAYGADRALLAQAIAWWTAAGGVSIAAGPVLGGLLVSWFDWRAIFWVNLPLCALGAWLTLRAVPALRGKPQARRVDLAGQLLAIVALTALVGAVIEANALGLGSALLQGALLVALAAGVLFIRRQRQAAAPMLPPALFRSRALCGALLFGVLVNFAYYGVIFIFSIYLQQVRGYPVLQAGLIFLPLTGTFIFSNIASGWLQARAGVRLPMIAGGLAGAAGYAWLGAFGIGPEAGFLAMLPGLLLIPGGMGLAVPAMTTSVLAAVERNLAGTVSAVLNTARQVGGAMGVAICCALAAGPGAAGMMHGTRLALAMASALLLLAAALAWRCLPQPFFNQGETPCRT